MKLTVIILFISCCTVSAAGFGQRISLVEKNALLADVFKKIEKQTGYNFAYTGSQLTQAKRVSITIDGGTLEQVLDLCLENQPLTYTIIDKTIVIKAKSDKSKKKDELPLLSASGLLTGRVINEQGGPLAGATVSVKNSKNVEVTSAEGVFHLNVNEGDIITVSYVGYVSIFLKIIQPSSGAMTAVVVSSDRQPSRDSKAGSGNTEGVSSLLSSSLNNLIIKLVPSVSSLSEIIINKGYYTEKEKVSVSNVGTVKATEIEKQPVNNVLLALQARVPGLFVTQSSGISGAGIKVRIQGENSLANGNDPLYVVDGVPIDAQLPSTGLDDILYSRGRGASPGGWGNPLSYINPSDIERIDILKDADATAIYGSRAANGAILITTKKGKTGSMKFDLNMQTGWGRMKRRVDMMNTRQYLDMRYEAFANDGIDWTNPSVSANDLKVWDTTRYTNWQDDLLGGTAKYKNINASVSGGSSTVRYLVSGTYHKETTVFPFPDFADEKAAVHFNLNANSNNQKIRMQFSGNYMVDDNQLPRTDITQTALLLEPNAPPLLNADGSINWAPDANGNTTLSDANIMTQKYKKYVNKTYNLVSSIKLDYTLFPGLNVGSSFGYNYMQTNDFAPSPLIAVAPERRATTQRGASFGDRNIQSWIIEPQVTYRTKINRGTLDLLIGSTFQDKKATAGFLWGTGQLSDELLNNINAAASVFTSAGNSSSQYRYNALFGRVNYNWNDKYILSINARRDGSTRFGADNRFHNFGSIGGAWIFSNEEFFKSKVGSISFGKLRGSYGTTGSDQIGDYQFMSLYDFYNMTPVPYQGIAGLVPAGLPNPGLEWEETKKLQAGVDVGFLQDKIVINANWVRNRSSNQLLRYVLPTPAGFTSYLVNFPATIQNRNWEFLVTGKMIQKKNLSWTSSINLTIPQNKLIAFPGLANSTYSQLLHIGSPINGYGVVFHWVGVGEGSGDYLYEDRNGHLTLTPNSATDRTTLISTFPKFYGGFDNTITYKSIQLDFIFQFVKQTGYNDFAFWNGSRYPGMFARGNSNQPVTVLNRWQKPGDKTSVAKYQTGEIPYSIISDRRFADASYIRLKNVSLSWELPQKWIDKAHFRKCRLYVHGQNLLTFTNYKGLDPETQLLSSLPPLSIWTIGLQVGL